MNSIDINNLLNESDKHNFISGNLNNLNLDIELCYVSDFKNAKFLRDFFEMVWNLLWIPNQVIIRMTLVIDELNNNAIEYWTNEKWINKLRVKVTNNWDSLNLNIEVEDNWKWKKAKNALDMEILRAHQLKLWYWIHNSIRWRWLFLITVKSVDRLYFKDSDRGGLIVWIRKNVKLEEI